MSMTEKVAYLKGLADGMELGNSKDDKLLKAIIDTLEEMADTVDAIDEDLDVFSEQLDAVDEDLGELENFVYDDDCCCDDYDDCDDDCCCCGCDDDDELYDVQCPSCGEIITVDGDIIDEGSVDCPNCGEKLEFDIYFEDDDEDADEGDDE